MKLAAFWRTSLSDSKTQSQLYYFKQFEIHPLKVSLYSFLITVKILTIFFRISILTCSVFFQIRTCFLPGNPYASYSSAQETLRSLLHTVIKVLKQHYFIVTRCAIGLNFYSDDFLRFLHYFNFLRRNEY